MLSIDKSTFDDTRAIKVLVVPIGENSLFDSHFQTISVMRDTSVKGLTKPSSWTKENNQGFKYFDWSQGNLLFDYLRYDRVPNGPGDLDEFQSSRRVLMIIGLINYPELEEDPAKKIEQELEYFTRRHPNVILRRLFLFNYPIVAKNTTQMAYKELITPQLAGKIADPNLLVVFPPDLTCEGGSMVNVHLGVNVENAACQIIGAFGDQMRICENAAKKNVMPDTQYQIPLNTFYDEIEEREANRGSGGRTNNSLKDGRRGYHKKPGGRIRKWMGDLSMQTCSPRDALEHYQASIEVSRSLGDDMWLAGALEGYAAAILLAIKLEEPLTEILSRDLKALGDSFGGPATSIVVKALMIAEERAAEAISLYSKSVVFCGLEVECCLRVAKMQEMIGIDRKQHPWYGRQQRALAYVLHATSVPGLNVQQHVECMIEGALICKRLHLKRKYAFFLYIAAIMSAESDNMTMAHALLRNACSQYGIFIASSLSRASASDIGGDRRQELVDVVVQDPSASWNGMRRRLLSQSAKAAHDSGDMKAATRFMAALLRLMVDRAARGTVSMANWASTLGPPELWSVSLTRLLRERRGELGLGSGPGSRSESSDNLHGLAVASTRGGGSQMLSKESAAAEVSPLSSASVRSMSASTTGRGLVRQVVDDLLQSNLPETVHGSTTANSSAGSRSSPSVTSSGAASFLSQIGLSSSNAAVSSELEASFSGSMVAMINANNGTASSSSVAGSFPSYNAHIDDVELRPLHGPISSRAHSLSFQAKMALVDDVRVIGLPQTLQSLELPPSTPSTAAGEARSSTKGMKAVHNRIFFNSLLQGSGPSLSTSPVTDSGRGSSTSPLGRPGYTTLVPPPTPTHDEKGRDSTTSAKSGGDAQDRPSNGNDVASGAALDFLSEEFLVGLTQMLGGNSRTSLPSKDEQDVAVQWLAKLSQELAPAYAVALPNLLVSLRPLLLPEGVRPVELVAEGVTKAKRAVKKIIDRLQMEGRGHDDLVSLDLDHDNKNGNEKKSALFYDPFHKQDDDGDKVQIVWSTHTLCHVVATFYNPLSCPLHFTTAKLRLEGCAHTSYETSVLVPARCQQHEVEFIVMPRAPGTLRIVGLDVQVHAASYSFQVDAQGLSITALHETYRSHEYSRTVHSSPSRERGRTVLAETASYRNIGSSSSLGEGERQEKQSDGDGRTLHVTGGCGLRGCSTASIEIVSSGPTIELEAGCETSLSEQASTSNKTSATIAPNEKSTTSTERKALPLHHGECRKEWIRAKSATGAHVSTGCESAIVDVRFTAIATIKNNEGVESLKKYILLDFRGSLAASLDLEKEDRPHSTVAVGSCGVRVVKAALLSSDVPLADLSIADDDEIGKGIQETAAGAELLPLPLSVPLGKLSGELSLCLQLEWTHVPGISSVELIMEVVGDSDPGYEPVEALARMEASLSSPSSLQSSADELMACVPAYQKFLDAQQRVYCRKCSLQRTIVGVPSLTASFRSLDIEQQSEGWGTSTPPLPSTPALHLTVLQLSNLTGRTMVVGSTIEELSALIAQQQQKKKLSDESDESERTQTWVQPSTIALILPPHSLRNVLLPSEEARSLRGSGRKLWWYTLVEKRKGEVPI